MRSRISFLTGLLVCLIIIMGFRLTLKHDTEPNFKIISFEEFEKIKSKESNKLRIFNFWATWCAPCIKEMPYFETVSQNDASVELVFISLDDGRKPEKVTTFLEKKNIKSPVYLLNDVDYNQWIDKINPNWSGAIPATLFVQPSGENHFHEGELEESELEALINKLKP
ncbi:TlpA disulfide reductase family protein [Echinicola sp. 20G]|uniref:TlpA family protein disulfide reductase n=1 Tax=Echinicola sp. 20G TaxID=2781961 RepID=UPI001F37A7FB|nr:TlpA disulfide reductase family protein [Echinicola sp. 20G]